MYIYYIYDSILNKSAQVLFIRFLFNCHGQNVSMRPFKFTEIRALY
jgi:hypothetical protein